MHNAMRTLRFAMLALLLLAVASPASAADYTIKAAAVNIQKIMRDSQAAQSVRTQVEAKRGTFQKEMSELEEQLRVKNQELAKQRTLLSAEAFEEKRKQFRADVGEAQKKVQEKRIALDKAFSETLGQIQAALNEIVAQLAQEKGFNMAIPTSQILYAAPELDVTDEVLVRLNKKLPSVALKVTQ